VPQDSLRRDFDTGVLIGKLTHLYPGDAVTGRHGELHHDVAETRGKAEKTELARAEEETEEDDEY